METLCSRAFRVAFFEGGTQPCVAMWYATKTCSWRFNSHSLPSDRGLHPRLVFPPQPTAGDVSSWVEMYH
jgi:hypothetical protein